jgi:metal-dependent amidase/aminoacylase/carboxypeptidase family protein
MQAGTARHGELRTNTAGPPGFRRTILDAVLAAIARQYGERSLVPVPGKFQSEDFSFISERVPGCQLLIGSCKSGRHDQLHSAFYDPDERCIGIGAAAIARVALDLLAPTDFLGRH